MTDEIKVGDRFLVPVEVQITRPDTTTVVLRDAFGGRPLVVMGLNTKFLSTCTRLPPEIGVGDEVRYGGGDPMTVRAVIGGFAWLKRFDGDVGAVCPLSDLTLVKKAEKD